MEQPKIALRVLKSDLTLRGEFDAYTSLQMKHSHKGVGEFELHVPSYSELAANVDVGDIIYCPTREDIAYFVEWKNTREAKRMANTWIIRGKHIDAIAEQRVIMPPAEKVHDIFVGEEKNAMLYYVQQHITKPENVNRRLPNVRIAGVEYDLKGNESDVKNHYDKETGEVVDVPTDEEGKPTVELFRFEGRFQTLAKFFEEKICNDNLLGWRFLLLQDIDGKGNAGFMFEVTEGKDRSEKQSINNPVLMSVDKGTLSEIEYTLDSTEERTTAIVAGQGEGIERAVITLYDELQAWERKEMFVDARDVPSMEHNDEGEEVPRPIEEVTEELTQRGNEKLEDVKTEIYLEGKANNTNRYRYRKEWGLGDFVSVPFERVGIIQHTTIDIVREIVEPSRHDIEPMLSKERPNLLQRLKKELEEDNGGNR